MKTYSASEFKARALEIMKEVSGTGQAVLVTRRGRPLVRVESVAGTSDALELDSLKGTMTIHGDIVSPVFEEWESLPANAPSSKTHKR